MSKRLADCQRVIGYHFANPNLLEIALTHSSVRTPDKECNERQEFLGDSVLGLAITEELYKRLPDQQEGELTRIKSAVVSRGALYRVSMRMGLPRFVEVAKGVGRREELPVSLTANLVESIIGAIYLDAGFFPAREFILRNLGPEVEDVMNDRVPKNYKSLLQHEAQQILGATPVYRTIEEEGPDHRKAFTVAAVIRGTEYGRASGINKKEAEQESARHALEAITRRGRGRRRRPEGRGEGGRGDRGEPARGDDRDLRPRDREAVRGLARQTSDDDAWRAWAEGTGDRPAGAPARGYEDVGSAEGAVAPAEPAPYVVGPEPEEAYLEGTDAAERTTRPPPRDHAPTGPGGPEADAPGAAPASGDGEPSRGRRRRGRRGGRRRRGDDGPAEGAAPGVESDVGEPAASPEPVASRGPGPADLGPPGLSSFIAPEADVADDAPAPPAPDAAGPARERAPRGRGSRERLDRYAVDAPVPARGGRGGGRRGARSGPETPAAEPEVPVPPVEAGPPDAAPVDAPPARAPRERAPRDESPRERAPRERAPRERTPRERAPAPEAPPPAPAVNSAFGQGVVGEGLPPPPAPIDREVTPVGGVKAVKKAPVVPREKPPAGGFGVGL